MIIIIIINYSAFFQVIHAIHIQWKRNYNKLKEHNEYLLIRRGVPPSLLEEKKKFKITMSTAVDLPSRNLVEN